MRGRRRRVGSDREEPAPRDDAAYVELARAIREYVAEPAVDLDDFARVIDEWPEQLRAEAVRDAFAALPARERWEILAQLFDDDELRHALDAEHERETAAATRTARRKALLAAVRAGHGLDTRGLHDGEVVALGMFREVDAGTALTLGEASTSCARRLVLRATGGNGSVVVVEDVFNPRRGLFVTPDYDEDTWQAERLPAHAVVRVGAAIEAKAGSDPGFEPAFEPVLYPAGRVDVETASGVRRGRLHAGYVTVDGASVFTDVSP